MVASDLEGGTRGILRGIDAGLRGGLMRDYAGD